MFKNMKIEINEAQPLDEVVRELDGLGYSLDKQFHKGHKSKSILTWDNGTFEGYKSDLSNLSGSIDTTLAELKKMQCKI